MSKFDESNLWLEKAEDESLCVPDAVVAELVYVLERVYQLSIASIREKVESLVDCRAVKVNRGVILMAIGLFEKENLGFIDAYGLALVTMGRYGRLYTFDKK